MKKKLNRYRFRVWWACKNRPFFSASQWVEIAAEDSTSAELELMMMKPNGPFIHEGCCYQVTHDCNVD